MRGLTLTLLVGGAAAALRGGALPEPYGHTAQVSPHNPNSDREWHIENRWDQGSGYKPQDGPITEKPQHAPIPKKVRTPALAKDVMNKKKNSTAAVNVDAKAPPTKESAAPAKAVPASTDASKVDAKDAKNAKGTEKATPVTQASDTKGAKPEVAKSNAADVDSSQKDLAKDDSEAKEAKEAVRFSSPKPDGHTSQVHPTNGANDREWFTEYRWKKGSEYKPQDGAITEKPVPAKPADHQSPGHRNE